VNDLNLEIHILPLNTNHLASTLAPVPAGLWNYDANARFTAGDTYDVDGNTLAHCHAVIPR
jgi:hypothetical protein